MRSPKSLAAANPFHKKKIAEKMIQWDEKSLFKLGQVTRNEITTSNESRKQEGSKPISSIVETLQRFFQKKLGSGSPKKVSPIAKYSGITTPKAAGLN